MLKNIPDKLKFLNNWVDWKAVPDVNSHSGIKKIPINPYTGGQAMSNNPQTWSDFDTAVRTSVNYDGIGFMFSGSDYFGIDLDDCRSDIDSYLKGDRNNIVAEFIDTMQTYTEISQSGNGIHLICRGVLPPSGRRRGKVEMYDSGRYFIMTGKQIGNFPQISDGTERVKTLHTKYLGTQKTVSASSPLPMRTIPTFTEQELIEKMLNSHNGDKFAKLYSGDFSDYPSQSEADMAFCSMLAFWCNGDTSLMDSIYRSSGLMRDKWDRRQNGTTYGAITLAKAVTGCQSFYTPAPEDNYSIYIGKPSKKQKPVPPQNSNMYTLDDTGNAARMNGAFGDVLRYSHIDKRWLYYDNGKWHYDNIGKVYIYADRVLDVMKSELKLWLEYEDGKYADAFRKHMKKTRSHAAKRAMVKEFEHLVPIEPGDMDTNQTLVNAPNGIADLETGSLLPHNRECYMTRMLGCDVPEKPKNPVRWLKFLDDIFKSDKELIRYVQKALGYSLSGLTKEQCVFFLYGTGRNGKSTFLEIVRKIIGEYATNIQPESIMMRMTTGTANSDIARLKGARLVTSVEPNEGMRLNEGLLKQITGDDMITARKLYGDEFEYRPEFKLWMATNHKPTIRGTDTGIWRRIHIIPFTVTIPEDKIDRNLSEKLDTELPDILAWMMEGYRLWRFEGLHYPKVVLDAVKEYRNEMDVVSSFIDSEYCVSGGEVKAAALYAAYCQWATENNEYKMPSRKFGIEMSKRYNKRKSNGVMIYTGLSLAVSVNS